MSSVLINQPATVRRGKKEKIMGNEQLINDIKVFLSACHRQKKEYRNQGDNSGRFFQAGMISAFELVLSRLENKQEGENV